MTSLPKPLIPGPEVEPNPFKGLVSVIIASFNCASTLPRSIESLKNQSYKNIEIIVCDDASTDETKSLVEAMEGVVYLRREVNGGVPVARNSGAKIAKGEILLFGEADGYYDSDYIEKIIRYLHIPGVMGSINLGRKVWTDKDNVLVRHLNDLYEAACQLVLKGERGTGAWAFAREDFEKMGRYDEDCRIGADLDLVYRIFKSGGKTTIGGRSILYHKDPDNIRAYLRRAYRGGYNSGVYRSRWHDAHGRLKRLLYPVKYSLMALWPAYLLLGIVFHPVFIIPLSFVPAYLLGEDATTFLAWRIGMRRGDLATFFATPVLLWFRRLAMGYGRIRSFYHSPK
jgi:glycosyltransferase involved in cell wall biosynthesis